MAVKVYSVYVKNTPVMFSAACKRNTQWGRAVRTIILM